MGKHVLQDMLHDNASTRDPKFWSSKGRDPVCQTARRKGNAMVQKTRRGGSGSSSKNWSYSQEMKVGSGDDEGDGLVLELLGVNWV